MSEKQLYALIFWVKIRNKSKKSFFYYQVSPLFFSDTANRYDISLYFFVFLDPIRAVSALLPTGEFRVWSPGSHNCDQVALPAESSSH